MVLAHFLARLASGLPGPAQLPQRPPDVCQMSPICLQDGSQMSPRCLSDVSQMSPRCLPYVSQVFVRCLPDVIPGHSFW